MALTHPSPHRLLNLLRPMARLLALIGVGPMLLGLWYQQTWSGEFLLLLVLTLVSLCAVALAWRAEGIGGALIAMSGLAVGLVTCMLLEQLRWDVLLGVGGCEMVAGALLMVCWFREARRAAQARLKAPVGAAALSASLPITMLLHSKP